MALFRYGIAARALHVIKEVGRGCVSWYMLSDARHHARCAERNHEWSRQSLVFINGEELLLGQQMQSMFVLCLYIYAYIYFVH